MTDKLENTGDASKKNRTKTYKREFSVGTFVGCLAWGMFSGDHQFLETTFMPTLFNAGVALGLHEYTENMLKR